LVNYRNGVEIVLEMILFGIIACVVVPIAWSEEKKVRSRKHCSRFSGLWQKELEKK
jgi:hypothetical protein